MLLRTGRVNATQRVQLEDNVESVVVLEDLFDSNDVWMVETLQNLHLVHERVFPLACVLRVLFLVDDLHRPFFSGLLVYRQLHCGEVTPA